MSNYSWFEDKMGNVFKFVPFGKNNGKIDPPISFSLKAHELPNLWARFWMFILFGWRFTKTGEIMTEIQREREPVPTDKNIAYRWKQHGRQWCVVPDEKNAGTYFRFIYDEVGERWELTSYVLETVPFTDLRSRVEELESAIQSWLDCDAFADEYLRLAMPKKENEKENEKWRKP